MLNHSCAVFRILVAQDVEYLRCELLMGLVWGGYVNILAIIYFVVVVIYPICNMIGIVFFCITHRVIVLVGRITVIAIYSTNKDV